MSRTQTFEQPPSSFAALKLQGGQAEYPDFKNAPRLETEADYIERAKDVAKLLAVDVSQVRPVAHTRIGLR